MKIIEKHDKKRRIPNSIDSKSEKDGITTYSGFVLGKVGVGFAVQLAVGVFLEYFQTEATVLVDFLRVASAGFY